MDHGIPAVSIRSTTIKQTDQRYIPTFLKNTSCIFATSQMKLQGRQHKVQVGGGHRGHVPSPDNSSNRKSAFQPMVYSSPFVVFFYRKSADYVLFHRCRWFTCHAVLILVIINIFVLNICHLPFLSNHCNNQESRGVLEN